MLLIIMLCLISIIIVFWQRYNKKEEERIMRAKKAEKYYLSKQPWKCPVCNALNTQDWMGNCPTKYLDGKPYHAYKFGQILMTHADNIFVNDYRYRSLTCCVGWRCKHCMNVNRGGFACSSCGSHSKWHSTDMFRQPDNSILCIRTDNLGNQKRWIE